MPRGASWAIGRPALRAANGAVGRGSQWSVSTKSGADVGQGATMQGVKMPRLTNRMRRLARAHPEAVAAVSPAAVEDSRARYAAAAELPLSEVGKKLPPYFLVGAFALLFLLLCLPSTTVLVFRILLKLLSTLYTDCYTTSTAATSYTYIQALCKVHCNDYGVLVNYRKHRVLCCAYIRCS